MRLLLDEHYSPAIAARLRSAGHDAVAVWELGLSGAGDVTVLEVAASERRVLLTNNARDFVPLAREWAASGRSHYGVLLTSDASMPRDRSALAQYVRVLGKLMKANPAPDALADQVRWLP